MEISQSCEGIFLSQKRYAFNLLKRFKLDKCKVVATPLVVNEKLMKDDGEERADPKVYRSLIGNLLYLTASRPEIMLTVSLLSRYMQSIFSWSTKKQDIVAQSSAEGEYVAVASATNQAIWLRKILLELNLLPKEPTVICVDNKSAIAMAENLGQHGRTKHINIWFHTLRDAEKI
ncbi:uncharacterized protein LOC125860808 [Solanum stenotomum]|uniref:uncharacterized protein LOC125860808 n=1 Tax=Solanum stenotomum TaxID=172797 RepID=UPI0020D111B0|nr:uncharacterized protein LOC125860808 [Solanum stenotomum]